MGFPREQVKGEQSLAPAWFPPPGLGWHRGLTLHRVLHVLSEEVPHHLSANFAHVQFLGEPGVRGECRHRVDQPSTWRYIYTQTSRLPQFPQM